jgi:hypothetical protein
MPCYSGYRHNKEIYITVVDARECDTMKMLFKMTKLLLMATLAGSSGANKSKEGCLVSFIVAYVGKPERVQLILVIPNALQKYRHQLAPEYPHLNATFASFI